MVTEEYLDQLLGAIGNLCRLPEELEEVLKPLLSSRHFTVLKNILRVGELPQQIWFVAKGLAREVTLSADVAQGRTSWFWHEGDFVFAQSGFFAGKPSFVDIEVYPGTVLMEISRADFLALMEKFDEVRMLAEKIRYENEAARSAHVSDLFSLRHAEMVKRFCLLHREVLLIARRGDIASFLGIRDNSLHRYLKGT